MKKLLRMMACLIMATTMFSLTSCAGDDEEIMQEDDIKVAAEQIVGTWQLNGTREFWRFDADGKGSKVSPSHGENWDKDEDINEGEGNRFEWYLQSNGLMVTYFMESTGAYSDPEPDAPFIINSITDKAMTWTTNNGKGTTQKFTRVGQNR
ncbi:MAG: hypothetical protein KBT20_08640 [Bacteroidales bacterium]|nr:hypothetical protein [Candidatus Liminaster caballi]